MSSRGTPGLLAPTMGALFTYEGRRYRVTGWLRPAQSRPVRDELDGLVQGVLSEVARELGPRQEKLEYCGRESAVYVSGAGVAGVIVPIEAVEVVGRVAWPDAWIAEAEQSYYRRMVGRLVV